VGEDMRESVGRLVEAFEAEGMDVIAWSCSDFLPACEVYIAWRAMPSRVCVLEVWDWQTEESAGIAVLWNDPDFEMALDDGSPSHRDCQGCPIGHCPERKA